MFKLVQNSVCVCFSLSVCTQFQIIIVLAKYNHFHQNYRITELIENGPGLGHLTIHLPYMWGNLNGFLGPGVGNLTAKYRKVQMPGGMPGGGDVNSTIWSVHYHLWSVLGGWQYWQKSKRAHFVLPRIRVEAIEMPSANVCTQEDSSRLL